MNKTYLSARKLAGGVTRLYAMKNEWDKVQKKQTKAFQVYIGCKRADGTYNFNERAEDFLSLLRKTEYERPYYQWCDFRRGQLREESDVADETTLRYCRCEDLCGGVDLLLGHVAEKTGLSETLVSVFGNCLSDEILSLAFYCASQTRRPLYAAANWSESQKLPGRTLLNESDIARVLKAVTPSKCLEFLSLWLRKTPRNHRLSLDITSVSSYARHNPDVMLGYNRDNENLPQVNLLLMVDQQTKLPVWFEQLPGAISDITTIKDTITLLKNIDGSPRCIVGDRGFASKQNIAALQKKGFKFTMGLPLHLFEEVRTIIREAVANHEFSVPNITFDLFEDYDTHRTQGITKMVKWNGHRVYLHLFYCSDYKNSNEADLMEALDRVQKRMLEGKKLNSKFDQEIASRCFTLKETPKRGIQVKCLPEEVDKLKQEQGGFFAIASNQFKESRDAMYVYKLRDGVEKRFDDLKNEEDCRRLRVHSSQHMRARIFIQFLAEILRCYLLERKQRFENDWKSKKIRPKSVNDILRAMESLRYIHIEGHHPFYKRPTKDQLALLHFYGVSTQTKQLWPSLH